MRSILSVWAHLDRCEGASSLLFFPAPIYYDKNTQSGATKSDLISISTREKANLIRIMIWRGDFYRRRQIEDDTLFAGARSTHAFFTASHSLTAKSGSVCENVSGLYSYLNAVPYRAVHSSVSFLMSSEWRTASSTVSSLLFRNTTSRKHGEVALYMWMMAFFAPATESIVRLIRSSRAGVRT